MRQKRVEIKEVLKFNSQYKKSGLSLAGFARGEGLSQHTAQWYRVRALKHLGDKGRKREKSEVGFDEIKTPALSLSSSTGISLEISGVKIDIENDFNSATLQRIVTVLGSIDD